MQKKLSVVITISLLACAAVFVTLNVEDVSTDQVLESEWTEADEAQASAKQNGGVIKAIVRLKAYCIVAKTKLDAMGHKHHLKSGAMQVISAFGKKTSKEVVTEFAQTIGELQAAHPTEGGVSEYMITKLNEHVLRGDDVVTLGKGNMFMLDHSAFGLQETPDYFKKLAVPVSEFVNAEQTLRDSDAGKALSALSKTNMDNVYQGMLGRLVAKYHTKAQEETKYVEDGAKIAVKASLKAGTEKGDDSHEIMAPLPVASVMGGNTIRNLRPFKMPSFKQIQKEAMEEAKAYVKKETAAHVGMSVDDIVDRIEGILEGTTIRITTAHRLFADSSQSPFVKIVGSLGSAEGKLDFLPMEGKTLSQHFRTKGSLGIINRVIIKSDRKHDNPWLCAKFEVQVGHGNPWMELAPNGNKAFVDGWWLDGKSDRKGPYYRIAHTKKWLLLPTSQKMAYVKRFEGKVPSCPSLKCMSGKKADMEKACETAKKCQGFTFTAKASSSTKGEGCLKYRCNSVGQDTDTDVESDMVVDERHDYWAKQAFIYKVSHFKKSSCPTKCGFAGRDHKSRRWCEQLADGKEVHDEKCENWEGVELYKPPIKTTKCPATEPCYAYKAGPPTGACPGNCGRGASTIYGNMLCYDTTNNKAMSSHAKCQNLKLKVPAKKFKKCKGGSWGSGICHIGSPNGHGAGNCYVTPGHGCHEESREGWDHEERRECLNSGGARCYGGTINGNTKYMSCYRSGGNCIQSRL